MYKIVAVVAVAAVGTGLVIKYALYRVPPRPNLDMEKWWGIGSKPKEEDTSIKHFTVDFSDAMIADLRQRLRNRRNLTRPLEGTESEYGMNALYLDKVAVHWLEKYDFKGRVALMNQFPHFKTRVQGLDIHFVRVKPTTKGRKVLPILLLHGWPSSSREFDQVISTLTSPAEGYDFMFEVIAADLPGFGFSEGTTKPGLNPVQMCIIMRNLMLRLGFEKFYIHGNDWGSQCAIHMSTLFPKEILGLHTSMPLSLRKVSTFKLIMGSMFPALVANSAHIDKIYPLKNLFSFIMRESGYFHIQGTKPDTISVALSDSPFGLAAYIIEKMGVFSNKNQLNTPHGGIENLVLDEVLDTITIMWSNSCVTTSNRIFAELFKHKEVGIVQNIPTSVPTAVINFKYGILYQPDWILKDKFHKLLRSTLSDIGGHYPALQTPQVLAQDIFASCAVFLAHYQRQSPKQD